MPKRSSGGLLTKKYGPLPAWGWAVVGVGAFLAYRAYQANQQGKGDGQSQPGGFSGQMGSGGGGRSGRHKGRGRR